MIKIIGLTGVARSGKDTIGSILIKDYGYTRVSFADAIREVALAINPYVSVTLFSGKEPSRLSELVNKIGWEEAKDKVPEVRRLLQVIGTEAGRRIIGPNVWLDIAQRKLSGEGRFVITDVRFDNEAELIRKMGGQVWMVSRPGYTALNAHASEQSILGELIDGTFINDGSLEDLRANLVEFMKEA